MPYWSWITVPFPTPLIFRYHLPLRVKKYWIPDPQHCFLKFFFACRRCCCSRAFSRNCSSYPVRSSPSLRPPTSRSPASRRTSWTSLCSTSTRLFFPPNLTYWITVNHKNLHEKNLSSDYGSMFFNGTLRSCTKYIEYLCWYASTGRVAVFRLKCKIRLFAALLTVLWSIFPDPWHFETDPAPWIRTLDYGSGSCFFRHRHDTRK